MPNGYYEIKQAKDGQFHFNLKAGNHEVILSSELYTTKTACENGIESVQKNCGTDSLYERRAAKNGMPYFVLKARNHMEIGRSEMCETKAGMEKLILSVQANGVSQEVKDKTPEAA